MELSDRVRIRRMELGMTQDELARRMGYASRVSVNKIEMGRPVSQKIIIKLAAALEVSPAYLMGWLDNEEEPAPPSEKELLVAELAAIFNRLSPAQARQVIQYAQFLSQTPEAPAADQR